MLEVDHKWLNDKMTHTTVRNHFTENNDRAQHITYSCQPLEYNYGSLDIDKVLTQELVQQSYEGQWIKWDTYHSSIDW